MKIVKEPNYYKIRIIKNHKIPATKGKLESVNPKNYDYIFTIAMTKLLIKFLSADIQTGCTVVVLTDLDSPVCWCPHPCHHGTSDYVYCSL